MVWQYIILLNSLLWIATDSQILAKPGCADKCGHVIIPCPFGVGSDCYMNEWFSITCNNSTGHPTPFLSRYNAAVLEIHLTPKIVLINSSTPNSCGNYITESMNLGDNPYLIYSDSRNRFSTLCCGAVGFLSNDNVIISGCITICNQVSNSSHHRRNGCFGIDCCRTMIPYGLKIFTVTVAGIISDSVDSTCNYAFLADKDWGPGQFSYPFTNDPRNGTHICSCPSGYYGDGHKDGFGCVKNKLLMNTVLIGTVTAIGLLFLLLSIWWLIKIIQRRKSIKLKEKFFKRNGGLLLQQKLSSGEGSVEKTILFTSLELEIATDQFNENRILGRGGQGTLYKGMLTDGRIVAIKKSRIVNDGHLELFINEVVILSRIDHRNIMKLLGCCLETEVPLLVYEFIPNGTLSHLIHDQSEEFPMSWEMRLRIATEVASAISYLHSAASVPIYHRDIKSDNILLDEKFRAKVSDFGTSKPVAIDQTHLTTQVKGTFGYFDPQYFQSHKFTEKSDVYSFGVVLVELLTGKRPIFSSIAQDNISLADYFISSMEENQMLDILDPRVAKEGGKEELMAVASLANRCLSLNGRNRPSMKEVVMALEGTRISQGYLP